MVSDLMDEFRSIIPDVGRDDYPNILTAHVQHRESGGGDAPGRLHLCAQAFRKPADLLLQIELGAENRKLNSEIKHAQIFLTKRL